MFLKILSIKWFAIIDSNHSSNTNHILTFLFIRETSIWCPLYFKRVKPICLKARYTFVRNMCDNHFTLENIWGHLWNSATIFEDWGGPWWWIEFGTTDLDFPWIYRENCCWERGHLPIVPAGSWGGQRSPWGTHLQLELSVSASQSSSGQG